MHQLAVSVQSVSLHLWSVCIHLCFCMHASEHAYAPLQDCELFFAVQMTPRAPHSELQMLKHTVRESNRVLLRRRSAESKPSLKPHITHLPHTCTRSIRFSQPEWAPQGAHITRDAKSSPRTELRRIFQHHTLNGDDLLRDLYEDNVTQPQQAPGALVVIWSWLLSSTDSCLPVWEQNWPPSSYFWPSSVHH